MYAPQERNFYTNSLLHEDKIYCHGEKVYYFVYRLVLDAKPDRGML